MSYFQISVKSVIFAKIENVKCVRRETRVLDVPITEGTGYVCQMVDAERVKTNEYNKAYKKME